MATSQHIAALADDEKNGHIMVLKRLSSYALIVGLIGVAGLASALWAIAPAWLQISPVIAALSVLPIALPLSILRGIMLAELEVAYFSASLISEWALRSIGGIAVWLMGGGVFGVCAFVALSPYIAVFFSKPFSAIDHAHPGRSALRPVMDLTFAMLALQLAQFVLLESDLLIGARFLSQEATGEHAALILLQRIVFFGCFGLSAALVPTVASARARGEPVSPHLLPVILLFGSIAGVVIGSAWLVPNLILTLFMGEAYLGARSLLLPALSGAALLTGSYLAAVVLKALNDSSGIVMLCLVAVVQPVALLSQLYETPMLIEIVNMKLWVQLVLLVAMLWRILLHASIERRGEKPPSIIGPVGDTVVTKNGAETPFFSLENPKVTSR